MAAPTTPKTWVFDELVDENEFNTEIRDALRELLAVKGRVDGSIAYLLSRGVLGILPPPTGGKKVLAHQGAFPFWDTPAPSVPPDGTVTEPKLAMENSPSKNYVIGWDGNGMEWFFSRLKLVELDSTTQSGQGTTLTGNHTQSNRGDFAFMCVRLQIASTYYQSPWCITSNLPGGTSTFELAMSDGYTAEFRFSSGGAIRYRVKSSDIAFGTGDVLKLYGILTRTIDL